MNYHRPAPALIILQAPHRVQAGHREEGGRKESRDDVAGRMIFADDPARRVRRDF